MAKEKKPDISPDAFLAKAIKENKNKAGSAYLSIDHCKHTYGVRIPALAFQWMIGGINVLPLSRILGISGDYGSMKSTLAMEIGSWFMLDNGVHAHIDTEEKTPPTMYGAIRYDMSAELQARSAHQHAISVEAWQEMALTFINNADADEYRDAKPGTRVPVFTCVDSLTGKESKSETEQMKDRGYAEQRGYATLNNQIKKFFAAAPLFGVPILLAYTTHMKEEQVEQKGKAKGGPKKKELGGKSPSFYATLVLRLTKYGGSINYVGADKIPIEGNLIRIQAHKSSLGPHDRHVLVPCVWRYVEDLSLPSGFRQEAWWDWDWALGHLIWRCMWEEDEFSASVRDQFKALFPASADKGSVTSPKYVELSKTEDGHVILFGDDKSHNMIELGAEIMKNAELVTKLQRMLHITKVETVQEIATIPGADDEVIRKERRGMSVEKIRKAVREEEAADG